MSEYSVVFIFLAISIAYIWWSNRQSRKRKQLRYIEEYQFLDAVVNRFREKYPKLKDKEVELVKKALKDYFYICNLANGKMVSMPSKITDELWHEFLLFSIEYNRFCKEAFGRFLHHTPTEAMRNRKSSQFKGLKRAWRLACAKEHINPDVPTRLPLLFAIDEKLKIANGNIYSLSKNSFKDSSSSGGCGSCGGEYNVSDFSDSSSSGGGSWGDGGTDSGCGGGCGGD